MTTTYETTQGEPVPTQEQRILAQQHAELRDKVIRNDFSTKGKALLPGLEHQECEHLDAKLNRKISEQTNCVAEIRSVFKTMEENLVAAIDAAALKDRLWEVVGAIDEARIDKPLIIARIIKVCSDDLVLCEQLAACIEPKIEKAEAAAEDVLKEVKAKMVELGFSPETMQAGHSNMPAAERQFEHFVRNRNKSVVAAFESVENLRSLRSSFVQQQRTAVTRLAQAKIFANEQMLKLVG